MIWSKPHVRAAHDVTTLVDHFPYAKASKLVQAKGQARALTRYLAESHELTEPEVKEQLELFTRLQSLARGASDIRVQDPPSRDPA